MDWREKAKNILKNTAKYEGTPTISESRLEEMLDAFFESELMATLDDVDTLLDRYLDYESRIDPETFEERVLNSLDIEF